MGFKPLESAKGKVFPAKVKVTPLDDDGEPTGPTVDWTKIFSISTASDTPSHGVGVAADLVGIDEDVREYEEPESGRVDRLLQMMIDVRMPALQDMDCWCEPAGTCGCGHCVDDHVSGLDEENHDMRLCVSCARVDLEQVVDQIAAKLMEMGEKLVEVFKTIYDVATSLVPESEPEDESPYLLVGGAVATGGVSSGSGIAWAGGR